MKVKKPRIRTMTALCKLYEVYNDYDYFQIIIDSKANGKTKQVREQYFQMPPYARQVFIQDILDHTNQENAMEIMQTLLT